MLRLTIWLLILLAIYPKAPTEAVEKRYTISLGNPTEHIIKAPVEDLEGITDDPDTWTEHECLSRTLYFEAGGEGDHGMALVAQATMNRVNSVKRYMPNTICQVIRQKIGRRCSYSFFCDGKSDRPKDQELFERAKMVADKAIAGYYSHLFKGKYFKRCDVDSAFFDKLKFKFRYKNHCFYQEV